MSDEVQVMSGSSETCARIGQWKGALRGQGEAQRSPEVAGLAALTS